MFNVWALKVILFLGFAIVLEWFFNNRVEFYYPRELGEQGGQGGLPLIGERCTHAQWTGMAQKIKVRFFLPEVSNFALF